MHARAHPLHVRSRRQFQLATIVVVRFRLGIVRAMCVRCERFHYFISFLYFALNANQVTTNDNSRSLQSICVAVPCAEQWLRNWRCLRIIVIFTVLLREFHVIVSLLGRHVQTRSKKKDFSFVIMRSVDIFLATFFYEFVRLQQNAKMESSERSILGKNKNKNIHFCFDGRLHRRCRCSWTSLRTLKHHIENILSREQRKRTPWNSPRRKLIVYMRVTETEESRKKERERAESTTTYMAIDASILENIK